LLVVGGLGAAGLVLVVGAILGNRLLGGAAEDQPTGEVQTAAAALPTQSDSGTGSEPTAAVEATVVPAPAAPAGFALITNDSLELRLTQVGPPPEGSSYHAWLLGDEAVAPLHLNLGGSVEFLSGELLVNFVNPEGRNLLVDYDQVVISLEAEGSVVSSPSDPVYTGAAPAEVVGFVRLASEVRADRRIPTDLVDLFSRQAGHFSSHAGLALAAIGSNNFNDTLLHGEHSLNIIEGQSGEFFEDWNGNGRAENPGDNVGLIPYVRLLEAAGSGAAISEQQRGGSGEIGLALSLQSGEIAAQLLQVRETLRQIVQVDSLADIPALGLDAELAAALEVKSLIDQAAAQAAALPLSIAIEVFPVP
jgi:hypothetical protein